MFPVPSHPSYPSNHSSFSAAKAEVLAYLFPSHADFIRAVGKEAGDSRIWAGIHYQIDNIAGSNLGKAVAGVFINWRKTTVRSSDRLSSMFNVQCSMFNV